MEKLDRYYWHDLIHKKRELEEDIERRYIRISNIARKLKEELRSWGNRLS